MPPTENRLSLGSSCLMGGHTKPVRRERITPVGVEAPRTFGHTYQLKEQAHTAALCSQIFVKEPRRHIKETDTPLPDEDTSSHSLG